MKKLSKQAVAGVALAGMLVTGLASSSFAKSGVTKNRSFTGVIQSVDGNRSITVSKSKKGSEVFPLNEKIILLSEGSGSVSNIKPGKVVEVSGKGQMDQVMASKIMILASDSFTRTKHVKSGMAYGKESKKTSIKGQVVSQQPLVILNRSQQKINVKFSEAVKIIRQVPGDNSILTVGKKVNIEYAEVKGKKEVKRITVKLVQLKKQAKK